MKLRKLSALALAGLMVLGMAVPAAAEEEAKAGDVNGDGKIVVGYISKTRSMHRSTTLLKNSSMRW